MPATVYFDTTIVSYLTAKTSRNLQIAEQQQLTYDWWNVQRINYELCCSQLTREEAALGDPDYARRRLELLQTMKQVPITDTALAIAEDLIREGALPAKAEDDAVAYCDSDCQSDNILADVELPALGQSAHAEENRGSMRRSRPDSHHYLHTETADGVDPMIENDPIVDEVREWKEEIASRFGHDLRAMVKDLQEKERLSGRPLVSYEKGRPDEELALEQCEMAAASS